MPSRRSPRTPSAYVVAGGSWTEREALVTAAEPPLSEDELAAVAPSVHEHDAPTSLVLAVLGHPAVSSGVVGRYATSRRLDVLRAVVDHPLCPGPSLHALTLALDRDVALAAARRLSTDPDSMLRQVGLERLAELGASSARPTPERQPPRGV